MRLVWAMAAAIGMTWLAVGTARADVGPELRAEIADEQARLRVHFDEVLAELQSRDVSELSPEQRARRAAAVERLREYRARGLFPENTDFRVPTPYFIDDAGTRCAMAHLIEESGATELVARVARDDNNALVKELASDAELVAWLEANGLTAAEAARIQPTYDPPDCDPDCRDDELCVQTEDGTACSIRCDPEDDNACGADSTCSAMLAGTACYPPVLADGPRPDDCSVGSGGLGAGLLVVLIALALPRRRRSQPGA